uniref:Internal scaffolding protein n=1 Tax=Dulem virus 147 TaxID=3145624 RepID=A0AAU8AX05_9VIRU
MMKFNTQYGSHERVVSNPGNPIKQLYSGAYNEKGQVELREDGTEDLYAFIQSFAESTDIHSIMRRFSNGEVDVLEKVQGFYGDITDMPGTYAEALQRIADSEKVFMSLPVEVRAKFGHNFSEFLAASQDADFLDRLGVNPIEQSEPVPTDPQPVKEGEVKE